MSLMSLSLPAQGMARATRVVLAKVVPTTQRAAAAHPPMPSFLGPSAAQAAGAVGIGLMLASRLLLWGAEAKVHGVGNGSVFLAFELELLVDEHSQLQCSDCLVEVAQVIHDRVSKAIRDASSDSLTVHLDGSCLKVYVDRKLQADIEILRSVPVDGSAADAAEKLLKESTKEWAFATSQQMAGLLNVVMAAGTPLLSTPQSSSPAGGSLESHSGRGFRTPERPRTSSEPPARSPRSRTGTRDQLRSEVRAKLTQYGAAVRDRIMQKLHIEWDGGQHFGKADWLAISMELEKLELAPPQQLIVDIARQ